MNQLFFDLYQDATIEDCMRMYESSGKAVVLNDGKVVRFEKEG